MRFTIGCTRQVILTRRLAIKLAIPFHPLAPFITAFRLFQMRMVSEKLQKYEGKVLREMLARVFGLRGLRANRQEIRIAREHPEYPIAPVLRSYLGDMIIVMPRGEAVEAMPEGWDRKRELPAGSPETDLFWPHQVCRFDGTLRFVDFGYEGDEHALNCLFGPKIA